MNRLRMTLSLIAFSVASMAIAPFAYAESIQIQAGQLEVRGGFQRRQVSNLHTEILAAAAGVSPTPAVGAIDIPHAGEWHLWVQSRSLPNEGSDARRFSIRLGQHMVSKLFGGHRLSYNLQLIWEDGGKVTLPAGPLMIIVGEKNTINAQCGHILLTDNPTSTTPDDLLAHARPAKVVPLVRSDGHPVGEMEPVTTTDAAPAASIANDLVRVSFLPGFAPTQKKVFVQQIEVHSGSQWNKLSTTGGADSYRLVYREPTNNPHLMSGSKQFPTWDLSYSSPVTLTAGGVTVKSTEGSDTAPWMAGQLFQLRPTGVTQVDAQTVDLTFDPLPIGTLTARWHLIEGQPSASVSLSLNLSRPGYVSFGYHGAVEEAPLDLDFLMLPYMYLGHRFPQEAISMPSNETPTPAALVTRKNISYAVMAEPGVIPFEWPSPLTARYLLAIRNESGKAEPMIYSPVFGSTQSLHNKAEIATAQFRIWAQQGEWTDAYRGIVTKTYGLHDYRVPTVASLSDAVLNLSTLMKNDDASGWSPRAKGSWNIEAWSTVTQPSPLTYLSYALLTGDEAFYKKYALPSLEFLLSRPSPHFSAQGDTSAGAYANTKLPLGGPIRDYSCTVFASAYRMTQGATPAFANDCFKPDHSVNSTHSHSVLFDDELELYETTGDPQWLTRAEADADKYIAENLIKLPSRDLGQEPFVNVSFTPDWEGLLHLYEMSHEARYLKAAHDAAYWLMSTIWTQPSIPNTSIMVHPDHWPGSNIHIWWKGDHFYRLGFFDALAKPGERAPKVPEISVPSAIVPTWTVSQVGLGIEQPETYAQSKNDLNILMSVWAPNLLRLGALTGDTLMRTYARNATIGRFSNYPGYYAAIFSNLYQAPDYVYKGPDVTSIYYHHIAPFAAYVVDYVFSDAEVRSHGEFAFPAARQYGYVWFDSRMRGFAPGKVYGETAWPWIHPTAALADNINVDVVLAHNKGTLFAALMNQTNQPQHVTVHFDASVLGVQLDGSKIRLWVDNKVQAKRVIKNDTVQLNLAGDGFAVLAVDGLHIHVPAHEVTGPTALPVQLNDALEVKSIAGTKLKATGTYITSPQFHSREFYAYVQANGKECGAATLVYRIGKEAEERKTATEFPCEFSIDLPYDQTKVDWHVEAVQPGVLP